MRIFPFLRLTYDTDISKSKILTRIQQNTFRKDWNVSFDKIVDNQIFEGEITGDFFLVIRARYALTLGRTSLLPVLRGRVMATEKNPDRTKVRIVIKPLGTGLMILLFFYIIATIGFFKGLATMDIKLVFFTLLFFVITYASLMTKFNQEVNNYLQFIERKILIEGFIKN